MDIAELALLGKATVTLFPNGAAAMLEQTEQKRENLQGNTKLPPALSWCHNETRQT